MNILVVDVGGTNVKILATGQEQPRRFPSGPTMTPDSMVAGVKALAHDWKYEVVAMGYPGRVIRGQVLKEPHNLPPGWIGFDYAAAFGCPVKIMNDAAMQALGSYQGGLMLFLGLGTGLGSALVAEGVTVPMELGHLSYRDGTFEDYIGARGLARLGLEEWQKHIAFVVTRLREALYPDTVVLGGGNAKKLPLVPAGCQLGDNAHAFLGGFKMWERQAKETP